MVLKFLLLRTAEAFTPGSSRLKLSFSKTLVAVILGSTVILLQPAILLPYTLIILAFILIALRGCRVLLDIITVVTPFTLVYVVSGLIVQHAVGAIDPVILAAGSARMLSMTLLSAIAASVIRVSELVKQVSRISPLLAVSIALTLKLAYTLSISLVKLQEVYSVNMLQTLKGTRGRLLYTKTLARALTHIGILTLLQVTEALYTRYPVITVKREESAGRNLPSPGSRIGSSGIASRAGFRSL
ncbi:MAG: hypothetical protein OWQ48_06780 [Desulfurococcus sp.]|nr:hypothetical protein [Desulfurococcus sp.]